MIAGCFAQENNDEVKLEGRGYYGGYGGYGGGYGDPYGGYGGYGAGGWGAGYGGGAGGKMRGSPRGAPRYALAEKFDLVLTPHVDDSRGRGRGGGRPY